MILTKGNFLNEHDCAEVATCRLYDYLTNQDFVFVQLPYSKERLAKVNKILAQFGFPEVVEVTPEDVKAQSYNVRIFGKHWIKVIAPRSTPVFHATLRALRDGDDWKYTLLEIAAKIEQEHGCHWIRVKGIEAFLTNYVHPKLYAEQLKDALGYFQPILASLILLQLGLGPQVREAAMRQNYLTELRPVGQITFGGEYISIGYNRYEYRTRSEKGTREGAFATDSYASLGNYAYYIHDDPTVLDSRNWLVQ